MELMVSNHRSYPCESRKFGKIYHKALSWYELNHTVQC